MKTVCPSCKEKERKIMKNDKRYSYCDNCEKAYRKKRYHNNKEHETKMKNLYKEPYRQLILSFLQEGCVSCGEDNVVLLEFDHRNPSEKSYQISKMERMPLSNVRKEISKCDILCASCHRLKTGKDLNWWAKREWDKIKNDPQAITSYDYTKYKSVKGLTLKELRKLRSRMFVFEYKLKHNCVDCGETNPLLLDFDHRENKKYSISFLSCHTYSTSTIQKEINKCDVRCVKCHKTKTARQFNWYKLSA